MKIIIDIRSKKNTGIWVYAYNCLMNIIKLTDFEIYIVCFYWQLKFIKTKVEKEKIIIDRNYDTFFRYNLLLNNFILDKEIDLLLTFSYKIELDLKIPFIIFFHDTLLMQDINEKIEKEINSFERSKLIFLNLKQSDNAKKIALKYFKYISKKATLVLTVSKTSKKSICSYIPNICNKIFVTYPGPSLYPKKNQKPYALTICQNKSYKNIDFLIDTFENHINGLDLIIVCNYEYGSKKIKIINNIQDSQLADLIVNSSIYVNASDEEGFCIPVLDAINFGKPVLLPKIPVFEELYSKYASFYISKNRLSFIRNLKKLVRIDNREIINKYNWQNTTKEIIKVLNEVKL